MQAAAKLAGAWHGREIDQIESGLVLRDRGGLRRLRRVSPGHVRYVRMQDAVQQIDKRFEKKNWHGDQVSDRDAI